MLNYVITMFNSWIALERTVQLQPGIYHQSVRSTYKSIGHTPDQFRCKFIRKTGGGRRKLCEFLQTTSIILPRCNQLVRSLLVNTTALTMAPRKLSTFSLSKLNTQCQGESTSVAFDGRLLLLEAVLHLLHYQYDLCDGLLCQISFC